MLSKEDEDACAAAGCGVVDPPGIRNLCPKCFREFFLEEQPRLVPIAARLMERSASFMRSPAAAAAAASDVIGSSSSAARRRRSPAPHLRRPVA
ncbi:hypothetical protein BHE74_00015578 [Ensete ventricosum]|nr:hypothetical protein GW17_00011550 [Ensete ventricosum]RWW76340.1 hypothetical protein BHE74_00015578 [Ensete ventricosum]RZS09924.1 hypothetical protein BHM03_00041056 [Ensete ventricosum]